MATTIKRRPFEPKGDYSQAEIIHGALRDVAPGNVITYEDLERILGYDIRDRSRGALYTAIRRLEREEAITFVTVTGVGYRRASTGKDLVNLAVDRKKRARRQNTKGIAAAASQEGVEFTADDRRTLEGLQLAMANIEAAHRALSRKAAKTAREVKETVKRADEADERLARLETLVEKMLTKE